MTTPTYITSGRRAIDGHSSRCCSHTRWCSMMLVNSPAEMEVEMGWATSVVDPDALPMNLKLPVGLIADIIQSVLIDLLTCRLPTSFRHSPLSKPSELHTNRRNLDWNPVSSPIRYCLHSLALSPISIVLFSSHSGPSQPLVD